MGSKGKPLTSIINAADALSTASKWILTISIALLILVSFIFGVYVSSRPYMDRYPIESNWWINHERLHMPGVIISTAMVNTSCKQQGNIYPPHGDNITQVQWLGGWDGGFVGNFKIKTDTSEIIVPTPAVGYCIYLYDAPGNITVYGQDTTSGGWIKLGKRN